MSQRDKAFKAALLDGSLTGKIRVGRLGKGKLNITTDVVQADEILENLDRTHNNVTLDLSTIGVANSENRRLSRLPYWGPVIVHEFNSDTCWAGHAKNINAKGLLLEVSSDSLDVGQTVIVEFLGTKSLEPFGAKCEIIYIRWDYSNPDHPIASVGLKILHLDEDAGRILNLYVVNSKPQTESSRFCDLLDVNKVIGEE